MVNVEEGAWRRTFFSAFLGLVLELLFLFDFLPREALGGIGGTALYMHDLSIYTLHNNEIHDFLDEQQNLGVTRVISTTAQLILEMRHFLQRR